MKRINQALQAAFARKMSDLQIPSDERQDYLKWLRFYLDFCMKYQHPPRDPESLQPFLQKLAEKRQSPQRQKQAAVSIRVYYELMTTWPHSPDADAESEKARLPWDACYTQLKEEIRLRQYSRKTLQTYRTWTRQFQEFLRDKDPSSIHSDDARRFLTHLATKKRVAASTQDQAFNALLFLFRRAYCPAPCVSGRVTGAPAAGLDDFLAKANRLLRETRKVERDKDS